MTQNPGGFVISLDFELTGVSGTTAQLLNIARTCSEFARPFPPF